MSRITIPENIKFILDKLIRAGYDAYVVGGCVRDALRGEEPHDWDITTNALPEQIKQVFILYPIINNNGEKHGTVTVRVNEENYEITTFRTETTYTDHRHPDEVKFTSKLEEDLSRRDFTINAMAADILGNVVDLFDGEFDLQGCVIRCVGNANDRFEEDALRILRGLRFASKYNFFIEAKTQVAMLQKAGRLSYVSKERICTELSKMIVYPAFTRIMRGQLRQVLAMIIPELGAMFDFDQMSRYHRHDLWEHTLCVMDGTTKFDLVDRLAALFHDIGKPSVYSEESWVEAITIRHYTGHAAESEIMTRKILTDLKFSNDVVNSVCLLIRLHDYQFSNAKLNYSVKKFLQQLPENSIEEMFYRFISLRTSDRADHVDSSNGTVPINMIIWEYEKIVMEKQCFTLKQLAISGNDVLTLGFVGPQIGAALNYCLQKVVMGQTANTKEALIAMLKEKQL